MDGKSVCVCLLEDLSACGDDAENYGLMLLCYLKLNKKSRVNFTHQCLAHTGSESSWEEKERCFGCNGCERVHVLDDQHTLATFSAL